VIERLDPLSDPRWLQFVDRVPGALIFHHPAWLRLVCSPLDFGRTDPDNHGLRGCAPSRVHGYSRFGSPVGANGDGRLRRAMNAIIPRAPALFGRLVGSGLYRHFGDATACAVCEDARFVRVSTADSWSYDVIGCNR
jgi:hypothetical protein